MALGSSAPTLKASLLVRSTRAAGPRIRKLGRGVFGFGYGVFTWVWAALLLYFTLQGWLQLYNAYRFVFFSAGLAAALQRLQVGIFLDTGPLRVVVANSDTL